MTGGQSPFAISQINSQTESGSDPRPVHDFDTPWLKKFSILESNRSKKSRDTG